VLLSLPFDFKHSSDIICKAHGRLLSLSHETAR
jgi:hypothetical protein